MPECSRLAPREAGLKLEREGSNRVLLFREICTNLSRKRLTKWDWLFNLRLCIGLFSVPAPPIRLGERRGFFVPTKLDAERPFPAFAST
jgi:hypothetical protein